MSSSANGQSNEQKSTRWQDALAEICERRGVARPQYQMLSDRRGGRTAWSSVVLVNGESIEARLWYDGKYVNNAREAAAEWALRYLVASKA